MDDFGYYYNPIELTNSEGFNSSAPTRTTATVTPTHLTSIEETFIDLQPLNDHAGFVPPPVATRANGYGIIAPAAMYEDDLSAQTPLHVSPGPSSCGESSSSPNSQPPRRRNMGGRRPNKDLNLSPDEEEKRRQRRERNKMAAARCRQRRVDRMNVLQTETDQLEGKKKELLSELEELKRSCEQLEYVLDHHRAQCRVGGGEIKHYNETEVKIKVEDIDPDLDLFNEPKLDNTGVMLTSSSVALSSVRRPERPTSLAVPPTRNARHPPSASIADVEISTPSTGITFNYDSLMDGGTGLTPVQPCATQTRHDIITTPEQRNNKLVSL